jgi:hypothetical protein
MHYFLVKYGHCNFFQYDIFVVHAYLFPSSSLGEAYSRSGCELKIGSVPSSDGISEFTISFNIHLPLIAVKPPNFAFLGRETVVFATEKPFFGKFRHVYFQNMKKNEF